MAISYKTDYGPDAMDFGLIDWFGSGGNSGGAGGALSAGAGAGGAIGSAAALLIAIGKEKWEKLFGGMDATNPLYIPPSEELTKPNENEVSNPAITDNPADLKWPTIETLPEEATKPETSTEAEVPKVEDVPKVETGTESDIKPPEQEPPIIQEEEKVTDDTFTNLENAITPFDPLKWAEEQQTKMWEREDAIRAETQAREDNAYQRTIEDMQRAGINPNLLGSITPAASGGGITNATPADTTLAQKQMEKDMELLKQSIDLAFKEDQNKRDRIWSLIEKVLGAGAMLGSAAIR